MLELQPFSWEQHQINLAGPPLTLRPDAASVMALVFHELTSNAVKYGALSRPNGRLAVSWELSQAGIALFWRERGGPVVKPPSHAGFGRSILEEILAYEFKGASELNFKPAGLEARFDIPGDVVVKASLARPIREDTASTPAPGPSQADYSTLKALVVEDNFIVAMMAKRLIADMGFSQVDTAASLSEAWGLMENAQYDFTLLDVNLQGELSAPLARHLESKGLLFAFASGYGSDGHETISSFDAPNITKPIDEDRMRRMIADLIEKRMR